MEKSGEHKIISFKTNLIVLVLLICLTLISVFVTKIDFGNLGIVVALSVAAVKSLLVFAIFMHLFYDKKMYSLMVLGVIMVMTLVLMITFLDYGF